MIPIRDTTLTRSTPVVNYAIIGLNVLLFLVEMGQGGDLDRFIYIYGLVPARYTAPQLSDYFTIGQQLFSLVSFMFLHGGFWHLLGNMWFLYIFGDNVEDHLGPLRYLLFYLLCGLASGVSHLLLNAHSNVPTIGASGAIAGVMGAYFLLHPTAKVLTLIPIIFIPLFVEIPAFFFLGFWFLLQFLNAAGSASTGSGIAWWAHIGGFIFGMIFIKLLTAVPSAGVSRRVSQATRKKHSHRLQVLRPAASGQDDNLYGSIAITAYEALVGTYKLVNIPWGFKKQLFRVAIPPGTTQGQVLRLRGMGKTNPQGGRGDLMLKVTIT
jgi:membrane associated rhomboid family serine protease